MVQKCLCEIIVSLGFKSVAGIPCLFIRVLTINGEEATIVIGIFVDDLKVTGNSLTAINDMREKMNERFILTDQGRLEYDLGVEVSSLDENTIKLHQTGYVNKILQTFNMNNSKTNPAKTPLPVNHKLSLQDCPEVVDPTLQATYRAIVGSLMYLYQWTRPDLGYAVTFLSRYLHKPGEKHLDAARHTLRYLLGTKEYGIH